MRRGASHVRQLADALGHDGADLWRVGPGSNFKPPHSIAASGPPRVLAIAGGGSDGAFAAGALAGWSETLARLELHM